MKQAFGGLGGLFRLVFIREVTSINKHEATQTDASHLFHADVSEGIRFYSFPVLQMRQCTRLRKMNH